MTFNSRNRIAARLAALAGFAPFVPFLAGVGVIAVAALSGGCSSSKYRQEEPRAEVPWSEIEVAVVCSGAPVAGAEVTLAARSDDPRHFYDEGRFFHGGWDRTEFGHLRTNELGLARAAIRCGDLVVEARARGFLPGTAEAHPEGGRASATVSLVPAARIEGQLVSIGGLPIDDALIEVQSKPPEQGRVSDGPDRSPSREANTHTDSRGHFVFEDLPAGRYELKVGFVPLAFEAPLPPRPVEAPTQGLRLQLQEHAGSITIEFVLPKGAEALSDRAHASLEVRAGDAWSGSTARLYTWPAQMTRFENYYQLPPGTYRVIPQVPGYRRTPSEPFVVEIDQDTPVRVALEPLGADEPDPTPTPR